MIFTDQTEIIILIILIFFMSLKMKATGNLFGHDMNETKINLRNYNVYISEKLSH